MARNERLVNTFRRVSTVVPLRPAAGCVRSVPVFMLARIMRCPVINSAFYNAMRSTCLFVTRTPRLLPSFSFALAFPIRCSFAVRVYSSASVSYPVHLCFILGGKSGERAQIHRPQTRYVTA